jgi:thiol-disulfide isomerase/thioredoxin
MTVYKLKDDNFYKTMSELEMPSVVKFFSSGCHLCVGLKPVFQQIAKEHDGQFYFFSVDVADCPDLKEKFIDDGIPTLYLFYDNKGYIIPEPETPHETTWYSEEYITDCLKDFTEGEYFTWKVLMI